MLDRSKMQSSSPLAALHRTSATHLFERKPHYTPENGNPVGGKIRQKQLERVTKLFGAEVRGSSPAASLCADISQNLGIDNEASPKFPTPRRALFPKSLLKGTVNTEAIGLDSSPLMSSEDLDASLKHHKVSFLKKVDEEDSPTSSSPDTPVAHSDLDDDDEMMIDSPLPARHAAVEALKPVDRNRRLFTRQPSFTRSRPSLANTRNLTENLMTSRFKMESRLNAIKTSKMVANDCFESESPPSAPSVRFGSPLPSPRLGSPAPNHIRRATNPVLRARKTMRRSLSMFEHAADVVSPQDSKVDVVAAKPTAVAESVKPSASIPKSLVEPLLPYFRADDPADSIPRITKATLVEVLDGKYSQEFDQKMIIDCRFEYEYEGGHIDGAVNYNDKELLARHLFETPMAGRTLLVFHCEYSAHRAPLMARHIRSQDRSTNADNYPLLTYPEVYILDGGYSNFFAEHRVRCSPQEYIEMSDARHQRTCEREMGRLKARKAFGRSKTFAFGDRHRPVSRELPAIREPKRSADDDNADDGAVFGPSRTSNRSKMPIFGLSKTSANKMPLFGPSKRARGSGLFVDTKPCVPPVPMSPPRLSARLEPVAMIGNSPILGERQNSRRMASF